MTLFILAHVSRRLFEEAWWVGHLGREPVEWWLARLGDGAAVAGLPLGVKKGFLNSAGDMLQHLGHRMQPYLPEICSVMVCLLQSATLDAVSSFFFTTVVELWLFRALKST